MSISTFRLRSDASSDTFCTRDSESTGGWIESITLVLLASAPLSLAEQLDSWSRSSAISRVSSSLVSVHAPSGVSASGAAVALGVGVGSVSGAGGGAGGDGGGAGPATVVGSTLTHSGSARLYAASSAAACSAATSAWAEASAAATTSGADHGRDASGTSAVTRATSRGSSTDMSTASRHASGVSYSSCCSRSSTCARSHAPRSCSPSGAPELGVIWTA